MEPQAMPSQAEPPPSLPPMVEMRKVSKWYGTFQALKDVSLTVR